MTRLFDCVTLGLLSISLGCSSGGWCGNNQPVYPVGTYPNAGYPNTGYPIGAQSPSGVIGNPGFPQGYAPPLNGQPTGNMPPTYSTPLPNGYPQGTYPQGASYPSGGYSGYNPQNQGVPLNTIAPSQPLFGR